MDNLNVLVEAKKEYLGQLCHIMCPAMIQVFHDMYDEATKMSNGRKVLIMYQKLLKEVPNWSNAMSKQHSDNITDRCAWYSDLLAAVFVACTKILSAVRLKADNKKISLKLPTNEVFIQTCYNNAAKDVYKDPYIFHEEQSEHARDEKLTARFCVCIENTIKELIPVQQILQTYMSQESRDINLDDVREVSDTEDPEFIDDENEMVPPIEDEPMPVAEGGDAMPLTEGEVETEALPMTEEDPSIPSLANEFKTIDNVKDPQQAKESDEDVLFGDAPEQKTKKVGYY
jgi:hypothetical protein